MSNMGTRWDVPAPGDYIRTVRGAHALVRHLGMDHKFFGRVLGPDSGCEPDDRLRCTCPGTGVSLSVGPRVTASQEVCCMRATQEDRVCDACRASCRTVES